MLERNRGARRDRTAHVKERGYREVRQNIAEVETAHVVYARGMRRVMVDGREPTPQEIKEWQRYYLVHEGRRNLRDNFCGDCTPGHSGPCDYCGPSKTRHRRKEHESLNAELAQYDPADDYGYSGWSAKGLYDGRSDGEDWWDAELGLYPLYRREDSGAITQWGSFGCCGGCLGCALYEEDIELQGDDLNEYRAARPWNDWWKVRDLDPDALEEVLCLWEEEHDVELIWTWDRVS